MFVAGENMYVLSLNNMNTYIGIGETRFIFVIISVNNEM